MTATTTPFETHKELHEGVKGNGNTDYLVVTIRNSNGSWLHTEHFNSKAEAETWIKYA